MTIESLLAWWNVIFVVPFLLALLYLIVYAASGLTFGDADTDGDLAAHDAGGGGDADADADVDGGAEFHADAHADVGADSHFHADGHSGGGGHDVHPSLQAAALSWLGLGRVPLSILLMVACLTWGGVGFLGNQVARGWVRHDWQVALISLPVAAVLTLIVTRLVVRSIDRWLPLHETTAGRRHDLLGAAGVAIYPITAQFGMVSVRDASGDLYQVACRMEPGRESVPKGSSVVLTGYSASTKSFYVAPSDIVGAPAEGSVAGHGSGSEASAAAPASVRQATERGR